MRITSNAGPTPIELEVNDSGGEGRPVVLIHGWPLSAGAWAHQVGPLTDAGHRVVSYDRRGFGASDKPPAGYEYNTMAGDLDAIMNELDLTDAVVVGFSMGGGEVARYVGSFGAERLSGAVFASAVPPYLLKSDDNPDGGLAAEDVEGMKSGLSGDRDGFYSQFAENFYSADGEVKVDQAELDTWRELAGPGSTDAALACIDAFSLTDFREDLTKFDMPVLVVHGTADAIVPIEVSGNRTAEAIPSSTLVLIEGGPHGITASHVEAFNTALLDFLSGLPEG